MYNNNDTTFTESRFGEFELRVEVPFIAWVALHYILMINIYFLH